MGKLRTSGLLITVCLLAGCGNVSGPASVVAALSPIVRPPASLQPAPSSESETPQDAAFIAAVRAQGLAPGIAVVENDSMVTDAHGVCDTVTTSDTDEVKRGSLKDDVTLSLTPYGITAAQAVQLIILSAKTYCPDKVAFVTSALS